MHGSEGVGKRRGFLELSGCVGLSYIQVKPPNQSQQKEVSDLTAFLVGSAWENLFV